MLIANGSARPRRGGRLLLLISTAYIAITLNIQGFVGMMPLVRAEFQISAARAGLYTSFYFLSATALAVFVGRIVDRLGSRRGLGIGTAAVGAMMLLHAVTPAYTLILSLAFLTGIGFSLITPSAGRAVVENFESNRRASVMGVIHGVGGSGALLGAAVMPALGAAYGWRAVLVATGLVALIISTIIFRLYTPLTNQTEAIDFHASPASRPSAARPNSLRVDLQALLSNRRFTTVCILGTGFGMALSSATAHMALFLHQDLGYSPAAAGLGLSGLHIGGILGHPSWGAANDRLLKGRRIRGLILLAVCISAMVLFFALIGAQKLLPVPAVLAAAIALGFCVLGQPSQYLTALAELSPREHTGLATGVGVVFSRSGMVVAPPVFGLVSDLTGGYTLSWAILGIVVLAITLVAWILTHRYEP